MDEFYRRGGPDIAGWLKHCFKRLGDAGTREASLGESVSVLASCFFVTVGGRHSPIFPAIIDTGHSHNFSIRHDQLRDWAGLALRQIGLIKVNQQIVPLAECDVVMDGAVLKCLEGIAVYPDHHPAAPRLPLLGLRTLVRNRVRVIIEGRQVELSVK